MSRENDFKGRCEVCGKWLDIILKRFTDRVVELKAVECPEHPGKSHILWPQRDDIIEESATTCASVSEIPYTTPSRDRLSTWLYRLFHNKNKCRLQGWKKPLAKELEKGRKI